MDQENTLEGHEIFLPHFGNHSYHSVEQIQNNKMISMLLGKFQMHPEQKTQLLIHK